MRFLLVVAFLPILAFSEIIQGIDTLEVESGFLFQEDSVVTAHLHRYEPDTTSFDFGIVRSNTCCLARGCCCNGLVSSPRTFFFSTEPIDSVDFSQPLDTNAEYMTRINSTSEQAQSVSNPDHNFATYSPDWLLVSSGKDSASFTEHFYVLKTAQNNFVLIQPRELTYSEPEPQPFVQMSCLIGMSYRWKLQTDGSLLFSTPNEVIDSERNKKHISPKSTGSSINFSEENTGIFSVHGKRITSGFMKGRRQLPAGIYLLVNRKHNTIEKRKIVIK